MTEEAYLSSQESVHRAIRSREEEERRRPERIYFIFENTAARERALALIEERREVADEFRQLTDWRIDPVRSDVGVELDFAKTLPDMRKRVEALFKEANLVPKEEHEVMGEGDDIEEYHEIRE